MYNKVSLKINISSDIVFHPAELKGADNTFIISFLFNELRETFFFQRRSEDESVFR